MRILLVHPGASIATADVWRGISHALKARGHEVYDYALDERIQVAGQWFDFINRKQKKRGAPVMRASSADVLYKAGEELVARTLRILPDVVLVVSAMYLHPDVLVLLRRCGAPVAVLFTESPYDDDKQSRLTQTIDLGQPLMRVAWTNERQSVAALASPVVPVKYLPHAFDPETHRAIDVVSSAPAHDVVFVGTMFDERIELLSAVDWTGIDLGLYGSFDLMGSRHKLRPYIRGGYQDNASSTVDLYRRAKIGLNLYRTSKGFGKDTDKIAADSAESMNPRAYELAATGCFTISDARAEVSEKFGALVPTFRTPSELRALLDRWLADDAGRARVRAQLPSCVAHDTWAVRAAQIEVDLAAVGIRSRAASNVDPSGTVAPVDAHAPMTAHTGG